MIAVLLGLGITLWNFVRVYSRPPAHSPDEPESDDPPPDNAPASAEPASVAEHQVTGAFMDMASGEIGELAPSSPPLGKLKSGNTWVWVSHHTEVSYTKHWGFWGRHKTENTLRPRRWYQAGQKYQDGSRVVYTEDGETVLGNKVRGLRTAPGPGTPPLAP